MLVGAAFGHRVFVVVVVKEMFYGSFSTVTSNLGGCLRMTALSTGMVRSV